MSAELEHIWSSMQRELAMSLDELTYRIWLAPLCPHELSGLRLTLTAPPQARGWLRDRFGRVLDVCAANVLGPGASVELISAVAGQPAAQRSRRAHAQRASAPRQTSAGARHGADSRSTRLTEHITREEAPRSGPLGNPKLTFGQFVIGDCNRLAHAAALTVAELPAQAYNPLFICGPPGVGKTHLLNSIASLLLAHNPGLTVRCATGESFTNEFLDSLAGGGERFKARFRDVDVLLLDDVHFLERKTKTEEEFFHTFNALHDGGRQIVLTSDRPPRDLQALEDRLRERFACGLVADVAPPDLATRIAILHKRADHDAIRVADKSALTVIAERIEHNVRELEGALIRVVAFSSLTGRALDVDLAREVLDNLYTHATRQQRSRCSSGEIQAAVAAHFELATSELLSSSRVARVAWPRQLAMYLARELTSSSLPAIGRDFGGRDHTTVLHACRRAATRLEQDRSARGVVEKLCRDLGVDIPRHQQQDA